MKNLNGRQFVFKPGRLGGSILRFTVFLGIFVVGFAFAARADDSANSASPTPEYAHWIKSWQERPTTNSIPNGPQLKAVVTIVQGEAPVSAITNMTPVQRLYVAYRIRVVGTEISTNGLYRCYFTSNTDAKSAMLRSLSPENLKQLDHLLSHLPDDHGKLPPPGQRVVVQVLKHGQWDIHVYDGTAMPPQIHSLLALIHNPFYQLPE